jgi:hypothetical protein
MDLTPKFKVKTAHYILAGFGVVAALSWNNTIRNCVESILPPNQKVCANVLYSVILTLLLVILIYLLPETKTELPIETRAKITEVENLR